jgi:hypothetical protein
MTDTNLTPELSTPGQNRVNVENLSLLELLGRLLVRPTQTLRGLGEAADRAAQENTVELRRDAMTFDREASLIPTNPLKGIRGGFNIPARSKSERTGEARVRRTPTAQPTSLDAILPPAIPLELSADGPLVKGKEFAGFVFMSILCAISVFGGYQMLIRGRLRTPADVVPGIIFLLLGGIGFVFATFATYSTLRLPRLEAEAKPEQSATTTGIALRVMIAGGSTLATIGAYLLNSGNRFTDFGLIAWFAAIIGWIIVFSPTNLGVNQIERIGDFVLGLSSRVIAFRITPVFVAMVVILGVGFYLRYNDLAAYPPDMTSDHVEKVLDAQRISNGDRPVFLANNGGREIGHFYLLAFVKTITGLPADFNLLKIVSGFEGLLGILAMFFFGRSFFEEDKKFGTLVGLAMAGLLAVSYWHIMLSRLGLRIVLTPLMTTLILIYFVRAMRYNRRSDFIWTGIWLGVGVYCYQAMRMTPIFLIVGLLLALIWRARDLKTFSKYIVNFAAIVIISLAIFAPLGRYMIQSPNEFWARTTGRLFGEDTIEVKDEQGNTVSRIATNQDRLEAFQKNIGFLFSNINKAIGMFNWYGDAAWVTGTPDASPEMDRLTGALLILGLGAWLVRMIKRRDPADWLIPFGVLVMLLPTALSLAFTIEVPSATRASGTIPFTYLLAGFAAALILRQAWRSLRTPVLRVAVIGGTFALMLIVMMGNQYTYFTIAMNEYRVSTLPHAQAGTMLRGFADSTGSAGNVFMVAFPYWWDHRALMINGQELKYLPPFNEGKPAIKWDNGVLNDNLIQRLQGMIRGNENTPYAFRTDRQAMFFIHQQDQASMDALKKWLPQIEFSRVETGYSTAKDFIIGVASPVGCEWYLQTFAGARVPEECLPKGKIP